MIWDDSEDEIIDLPTKSYDLDKQQQDICTCGEYMQILENNGAKQYVCNNCGRIINTTEAFDVKEDIIIDLEEKKARYGSKSGDMYMKKVKDEVMTEIKKVAKIYPMTETQISSILKKFLTIRSERIPRAKPRIGLISACIQDEIKLPTEMLSTIFSIPQKHITEGIKTFNKELLPFNTVSIENIIVDFLNLSKQYFNELFWINYTQLIIDLIKVCCGFYIGYDTTIKTKCVGTIWYICQAKKIKMPEEFIKSTKMGKNTLHKFYDQLIVFLHAKGRKDGLYQAHFENRSRELKRFMRDHDLELVNIELKGRYLKFLDLYDF